MGTSCVALLRGINVGGNDPVPMAGLREAFAELCATDVRTCIQGGNVLFDGGTDDREAWAHREMTLRSWRTTTTLLWMLDEHRG